MDNSFLVSYAFKSVPLGILLTVLLGPLGLLYGSLRGGIVMILIGIVVLSVPYPFPIIIWWVSCCIWSVYAIEKHNAKQLNFFNQLKGT